MVARSLMSRSKLASNVSGSNVAEYLFQFAEILDGVPPLPQRRFPLFLADILVSGQAVANPARQTRASRGSETAVRSRALFPQASRSAVRA